MNINLQFPVKIFFITLFCFLFSFPTSEAQTFQNFIHPKTPRKVELNGSELWIASIWGGLMKYDIETSETTFYNRVNSDLPNNTVFNVAVDSLGYKWVLTRDHISKMKDDVWTIYDTLNYSPVAGFREIEITSNNDIYVFGQQPDVFLKFNGQTWQEISIPSTFGSLTAMTMDKNDTIWFLHDGTDLVKYQGNVWEFIEGPSPPLPGGYNNLEDLTIDTFGNKWMSSFEHGILKYDDTIWWWITTDFSNLPDNSCGQIYADKDNLIWVNSGGNYISKFDGTTFENISFPNVPQTMVSNMVKDKDGQLWYGNSKGYIADNSLQKLVDTVFTGYDISSTGLLQNGVWDFLFEDGENAWMAGDGLVHFDGTTWSNHLTDTILPYEYITAMEKDSSGHLWLAGYKIFEFDPSVGVINEWMIPPAFYSNMHDIEIDENNVKWIASSKGIIKLDGNDLEVFNFINSDYPGYSTREIEFNSSNNMIVGATNGLYEYDGTDWVTILDMSIHSFHITEDQTIWMATDQGLGRFDGTDLMMFDTSNSDLPHNYIHDIAIEDDSIIWATTSLNQIVRFDGENVYAYNHDNSPLSSSDYFKIIEIDPLGRKWVSASGSGVTVIDDSDVIYNPISIKPIIKNSAISIYPNPTTDQIFVEFNAEKKGESQFIFFDLTGKKVKSFYRSVNQIFKLSISDLQKGIYVLEIRNGSFTSTHKVVKF